MRAVFDSWFGKRAHDYREFNKIPHDLGTAVNVVTMVFGNMGDDSGTGVAFTRDPNTGEQADLRRVPDERPGRGRRGRRAHAREDQPDARRAARGVRAVRGDRAAPRGPLPRDAGPRVHDRARHALHAPDALREAHRTGRGEDRGRHGQRGRHHEGGGAPARRSRRRSSSSCSHASTRRPRRRSRTGCSARA